MGISKNKENLEFLSSYWGKIKIIKKELIDLPNNFDNKLKKTKYKFIYTKNFSELENWSIHHKNITLCVLIDKIIYMIDKGRSIDIQPMLISICNNTVRKHTWKNPMGLSKGEFLGYGHFRWNYQAYILTPQEIIHLKSFFQIE
jgi:hypothetical protein